MDHFPVIQSMCRLGLATESAAFRKQAERLLERLTKAGDKDAETLRRLLEARQRSAELEPSRIELSRQRGGGEVLSRTITPPHDRETNAPLAEIIFEPLANLPAPVLNPELKLAVDALIDEWTAFDALATLGVAPSRTCLLFGPPGTGKTLTALNIAARLNLPVVVARLDGIVSSFLGTTARNIGALFEFANRYRCVLLLDEFDALAKLRDDPQEVGEIKRVVNTLLQSLDSRSERGVSIAITNHPSLLDPAIWRRFEVKIEMPKPQYNQRAELFLQFLHPLRTSDLGVQTLAWASEDATGAEVRAIANSIKRYAALQLGASAATELKPGEIVEALARYYVTSADLTDRPRLASFRGSGKALAKALLVDQPGSFNQSSIAALLGKDQATISRWMREEAA